MAKQKQQKDNNNVEIDDFTNDLIQELNKQHQDKIAFNLGSEDAPTNVKRWISTGSKQLDWVVANRSKGGLPEGRIVEVQGPPGCHSKGTKVLLSNGESKNVEDIQVGDKLLGPDGDIRIVIQLHSGKDKMYDVVRPNGETFRVNQHHILSLKRAKSGYKHTTGRPKGVSKLNETINISVKDYLEKSKTFKKQHRLYRPEALEFQKENKQKLPIDPYILGLLIGDGCLIENQISITTADKEIRDRFKAYVNCLGKKYSLKECSKTHDKASSYRVRSGLGFNSMKNDRNVLRKNLQEIGLLNTKSETKFIPLQYKTSNIENRKKLLAGLIDTDGSFDAVSNKYEYSTKSYELAKDIQFIVRSLGGKCSLTEKYVNENVYYRLYINGLCDLPVKLERKKCCKPSSINPLYSNFQLKESGYEEYYGFTLDKDQLYMLDDFTVNHNSGKSTLVYQTAKSTQEQGGMVVYIDTENATNLDNLKEMGIDVDKRFVFCQTACTEEIFSIAENTIHKARAMTKDVPITIVWDSVAASSPKAELTGDYDEMSIGLQARTISRGIRKISQVIGNENVLFLLVNQQRKNIGVQFGQDSVTPGGMAIPYASSVRLEITSTGQKKITNKNGDPIGIHAKVKTLKNKVSKPFRACEFEIHFGKGIVEHEEVFEVFKKHCKDNGPVDIPGKNHQVSISGEGAWKVFSVINKETGEVEEEVKFQKSNFGDKVLYEPKYQQYMDIMFESAFHIKPHIPASNHPTFAGSNDENK